MKVRRIPTTPEWRRQIAANLETGRQWAREQRLARKRRIYRIVTTPVAILCAVLLTTGETGFRILHHFEPQ